MSRYLLSATLRSLPLIRVKHWNPWRGLVLRIDNRASAATAKPPFGWRDLMEVDRDCTLRMPIWLYWMWTAKRVRWYHIRVGLDLGWVELDPGLYYSSARWTFKGKRNVRSAWNMAHSARFWYPRTVAGSAIRLWYRLTNQIDDTRVVFK